MESLEPENDPMESCYCAVCGGPTFGVIFSSLDEKGVDRKPSYYDPEVVSPKDAEWTDEMVVIGHNQGTRRAFISGKGRNDNGAILVSPGDDPNFLDPRTNGLACYTAWSGQSPIFPIHSRCVTLLTRYMADMEDLPGIDLDILYLAFHRFAPCLPPTLKADLGQVCGRPGPWFRTYAWWCRRGEEFLVADPISLSENSVDLLRQTIRKPEFRVSPRPSRITNEILGKLPNEIVDTIVSLLNTPEMMNLCEASRAVHQALHHNNNPFWKKLIKEELPWFFELHDLIQDDELMRDRNWVAVLKWADEATTPALGMKAPWASLANRRRIWDCCKELVLPYYEAFSMFDGPLG
ncbi:hypothetical protein QBC46DRAFT_383615 [Diplogelasinospora grovesii]|uniref:F-box domain-containing protein n=1 Tax=Diplogelasinospora grovesii TaxID=303347 RepID=A0AAN6S5X8_9PEZI|nr:hypothetical protein QBC46DRAFT_383615 [Diplogelasinospora grovesii]